MATKKKSSTNNPEFDRSLVSATRSLKWLLPETEEAVAESEQELELNSPPVAMEPMDPFEALDREASFSTRPARVADPDSEYAGELRRAARSGVGKLSQDIERRMREDRRRAEEETDGK